MAKIIRKSNINKYFCVCLNVYLELELFFKLDDVGLLQIWTYNLFLFIFYIKLMILFF